MPTPTPERREQLENIVLTQGFQWAPSQVKATPETFVAWVKKVVDLMQAKSNNGA